ncbi:thymic stromal lymphopoietin [Rattus rattus]|uniref:thymic stromal lymphopoietin n=1 Tax=Rattus rattus TaxID=10117 RepID=UPI0013F2B50A|nr:thymic stromal lymphopoietin [Rattus rattus]
MTQLSRSEAVPLPGGELLLRYLFILQVVRLALPYNFSNCDFEMILKIYRATISRDLLEDLNGILFDQIEDCDSRTACLQKIDRHTFNPVPGCPSLPEKAFALETKAALVNYCPGYSETERNGTLEMTREIRNICLNQTSQILGLWLSCIQS